MAALDAGDAIRLLDEDGTTTLIALVSRLDETVTIYEGPHAPYDITPVGVRILPDAAGELPHLPEAMVTPWESDARALAALNPEHRYGWQWDGQRG
ncbi:hypothetical protein [Actinomadura litoris]|uniref:hypothetical protein n=1 Tax=Actinomadura litoris TaxID=2678616 RepID=UPI001FA7BCDB|nr:hypothetical protein [Actinomadura litoris]